MSMQIKENKSCFQIVQCGYFLALITVIVLAANSASAANLLSDSGFESDTTNYFPSSGAWSPDWTPYESGALATGTAARTGNMGLWEYSANSTLYGWSGTYQDAAANPGDVISASSFIRSPAPGPWVDFAPGSFACIRIEFINSANSVLSYVESSRLTTANTAWQNYSIVSPPAPAGTAKARLRLYVEKPATASIRQAVVNFDDAYMDKTVSSIPILYLPKAAIGIRKDESSSMLSIRNIGTGVLYYNLSESLPWLSLSAATGSLAQGNESNISISLSRSSCLNDTCKGTIDMRTNAGNANVTVYLEMSTGAVPSMPSTVYANGTRLIVKNRLANGSLDKPVIYAIKGAAWTPSSICASNVYSDRRRQARNWYVADVQLLKEMNVNTVYTFFDFISDQSNGTEILDYLYKNNMKAIITVDEDGTNNVNSISAAVSAFKNHPAVLMWAIGNEWNINYYHDKYGDHSYPSASKLDASAQATQNAALLIKSLDQVHPVASIYGEIDIPGNSQPLSKTQDIINNVCTGVDVWGLNIYRGDNFGTLFSQWKSITGKPMFVSEFGTDSYYTQSFYPAVGYEDESMQSVFDHSLWLDIKNHLVIYNASDVCLGGTVFQSNDEWWKVTGAGSSSCIQDNGGYNTYWNPYAFPDGFGNEEYYGIIKLERKTKQAYNAFKADYLAINNAPYNESNGSCTTNGECSYLNKDYCSGTVIRHDRGVCTSNSCSVNTTAGQDCSDGLYCNGAESCANATCIFGASVNCSANNIPQVSSCANIPDGNIFTFDTRQAFTSSCNESSDSCTFGNLAVSSYCSRGLCSAECDANSTCLSTLCHDRNGCNGRDYYSYTDVVNTCLGNCSCTRNSCISPVISRNDSRCAVQAPGCFIFYDPLENASTIQANNGTILGNPSFVDNVINGKSMYFSGNSRYYNNYDLGSVKYVNNAFRSENGTVSMLVRISKDVSAAFDVPFGGIWQIGEIGLPNSLGMFYNYENYTYFEVRPNTSTLYRQNYLGSTPHETIVYVAETWMHGSDGGADGNVTYTRFDTYNNGNLSNLIFIDDYIATMIINNTFEIGRTGYYEYGNVTIDEVRYFNSTLNSTEIYYDYVNAITDSSRKGNFCEGNAVEQIVYQCTAGRYAPAPVKLAVCQYGCSKGACLQPQINISAGWNLISLYLLPEENSTNKTFALSRGWNLLGYSSQKQINWSASVVRNASGASYNITGAASLGWLQSTIYRFDARSQSYILIPGINGSLSAGNGFWLYSMKDGLSLTLNGTGGSYPNTPYKWTDAYIGNGSDIKPISDAEALGWLQKTIYYYDRGNRYVPGDDDNAYAWKGYWLYSNYNLTLYI